MAFLLLEVLLDFPNRRVRGLLAAHKEVGRIDGELLEGVQGLARFWVDGRQPFNFVVPKLDPNGVVGVRQVDVHGVAFDAEISTLEICHGSAVQAGHQPMKEVVAGEALPDFQRDHVFVELHGVADAVDATDAGHHNDVPSAAQQGRGGRQPELLDFVVDLQVLLDVRVGRRDERFRLVVVVVAHEILHQIVREEGLEFAVELCRQGLVVTQDERGPLRLRNHVGHGEGLARARHPEKHLVRRAVMHPFHKLANGFGLVPLGGERAVDAEGGHAEVKVRGRVKCSGQKKPRTRRGF